MSSDGKASDFYHVLGLKKECTQIELRNAYKKLALKWHPDRCTASGNLKFVEEAKNKFQNIHEAYSVLSDDNKRFLYDLGAYENDDEENGMGDFMNEMVTLICKTKPNKNEKEGLEELQKLFDDIFQDVNLNTTPALFTPPYTSCFENSNEQTKHISTGKTNVENAANLGSHFPSFCLGTGTTSQDGKESKMRHPRKRSR